MYGKHIAGWERHKREAASRREWLRNCWEAFFGVLGLVLGLGALWLFLAAGAVALQ